MKSICLSCLLYTLKDKDPKDNLYLDIFYIWLSKLIQSGGLTPNDILNITIDSSTLDYLKESHTPLPILLEKLQCPYQFIQIKSPGNSLEGMMNKYNITNYTQDVYIYCDIDRYINFKFIIYDG